MKTLTLRATFPKHDRRPRVARFEWSDGLVATTPIHGRPWRLPHDLDHYLIEARLRPAYGFWALAAQQAPFDSLTLVRGRWPKGKQAWFDRVRRHHAAEMLKAEATGVSGIADPAFDVDAAWPTIRRTLERAYAFGPATSITHVTKADVVALREDTLRLRRTWADVPDGGALVVAWPPVVEPRVVTEADADVAVGAGRS